MAPPRQGRGTQRTAFVAAQRTLEVAECRCMPVTPRAAARLRQLGYDAIHAMDVHLGRAPDESLIERARDEERIIVTADLDYPRLLATLGLDAPGVILFRGGSFSDDEMLELLDRALTHARTCDLGHSITVVGPKRIRVRRLPLARNG